MDEKPDPGVGENFVCADNISMGDLVYWDRATDGTVLLRRLEEWQLESFDGPVWRVEQGDEPLAIALRQVK